MEGRVASNKFKGKALASASDESKNEVLVYPRCYRIFTTVTVTKDPDHDVPKQPTITQADYGKDGDGDLIEDNFALIEAVNSNGKKKRKAEGESDKVLEKQKKYVIDLNKEPLESSQDTYYLNMSDSDGFVKEQTKISPVLAADLNTLAPPELDVPRDSDGFVKVPTKISPVLTADLCNPPPMRLGLGSWRNDDEKKRRAEGEPDKVPMKQKKQAIDINEEPPESPQNMTADLLRGFGNEICHSAAGSSGSSSDPVDLELRLGLANS